MKARDVAGKVVVAGQSLAPFEASDNITPAFLACGWLGTMLVIAGAYAAATSRQSVTCVTSIAGSIITPVISVVDSDTDISFGIRPDPHPPFFLQSRSASHPDELERRVLTFFLRLA